MGAPGQEEVQSSSTFGAISWGAVGRDVGNRISTLCENGESKAELLAGGLFIYLLLFSFFFFLTSWKLPGILATAYISYYLGREVFSEHRQRK